MSAQHNEETLAHWAIRYESVRLRLAQRMGHGTPLMTAQPFTSLIGNNASNTSSIKLKINPSMLTLKSPPTVETSKRLQQAFDIFNDNLFDGVNSLDAMLGIERLKNANGIYRPCSLQRHTKAAPSPAIALNSTNANERELPPTPKHPRS